MAQQKGLVKFRGSLDDLSFVKTKDGYEARMKSSLDKERIMTDPKFARTRENGQDFGTGAKGGKLVRQAFAEVLKGADGRMISRLHKAVMNCMRMDTTNGRGLRTVTDGDPSLLKEFDFNIHAPLSATVKLVPTSSITRTTGAVTLVLPAFVPTTALHIPTGATHYKFTAGSASIDFNARTFESDTTSSAFLPVDDVATTPLTLTTSLTANTAGVIIQVFGVQFFQDFNGLKYALNSSDSEAIGIVDVAA
jgi:hypothetical protein